MNCEDVQKYAFTYLDGEFGDRERAEFDCHLAACAGCRCRIEEGASFRRVLRRNLCQVPADAATRLRVTARLQACQSSRSRIADMGQQAPLALAAGLLLAAGVGTWIWAGGGQDAELPSMALGPGLATAAGGAWQRATGPVAPQAAGDDVVLAGAAGPSLDAEARAAVDRRRQAAAVRDAHDATVRLAAHGALAQEADDLGVPEVLSGAVDSTFLTRTSPFGAVRAPANLRALVRTHAAPLPLEVEGHVGAVRDWLRARLPGVQGPPVPEGAGVELQGARLSQLAGRPVVLYSYVAYGKSMTVVQHLRGAGHAPFEDPEVETERPGEPSGASGGTLVDHVVGFQVLHALRDGTLISVISELDSAALSSLVAPPTFL